MKNRTMEELEKEIEDMKKDQIIENLKRKLEQSEKESKIKDQKEEDSQKEIKILREKLEKAINTTQLDNLIKAHKEFRKGKEDE